MNDLISRSALLDFFDAKAFAALELFDGGMSRKAWLEAFEAVQDAPAVDAVEVVRCRGCIAFGKSPYGHPGLGWCRIYGHHFNPDYYCASGKKR